MRILGIDTSMATGSVALVEKEQVVAEYLLNIQATHSERLLPTLRRVLRDAGWLGDDLAGIAVALGPGSFTGLRIGAATAKALAYTWQKPLIGVTVLEGLAFQVGFAAQWVCSLVDARHREVYGCLYETEGLPAAVTRYWAGPVADFVKEVLDEVEGDVCFVGDGAIAYGEIIYALAQERMIVPTTNSMCLRASSIAILGGQRLLAGEKHDPLTLTPLYLRLSEAERRFKAQSQRSS